MPFNQQPLYGSVPYVTSLSETHSASVAWINSAQTWISISDLNQGRYVNFVSESGALEVFVFCSSKAGNSNRIKYMIECRKGLIICSTYSIHTLGFHFCKWANVSAEIIMARNRNFTEYGFPVDVFWMDIEWSD
jgi:alpha 1,3-glucosidase